MEDFICRYAYINGLCLKDFKGTDSPAKKCTCCEDGKFIDRKKAYEAALAMHKLRFIEGKNNYFDSYIEVR
jgi:hypothetical protein